MRAWLRIVIAIIVLLLAIVFVGAIASATRNVRHPTCVDVASGRAQPLPDGCYEGSSFQQYATLSFAYAAGVVLAVGLVLSVMLLFSGTRNRRLPVVLGTAVTLMVIAIVITNVSGTNLPNRLVASKALVPHGLSADEQQAVKVAMAYMHAFASSDWRAACATRVEAERARMARLAGTCERAFALTAQRIKAQGPNADLSAEGSYRPVSVRRRGPIIGVHLISPRFQGETKLATEKSGGRWLLVDIPSAKIP